MCVHVSVCLCGHMHVGSACPSKQEGIGHCAPVVPIQEEVTWPACLARWHSAQSGLTAWPAWGREGQGDDVHRNTHTAPFHKALLCILYLAFLKDPQPDFMFVTAALHLTPFLSHIVCFDLLSFCVLRYIFLCFYPSSPLLQLLDKDLISKICSLMTWKHSLSIFITITGRFYQGFSFLLMDQSCMQYFIVIK